MYRPVPPPLTCSSWGLLSLSSSTSVKKLLATLFSASMGHSRNQSIVQQLTSDGNMRRRWRNASPIGLQGGGNGKGEGVAEQSGRESSRIHKV